MADAAHTTNVVDFSTKRPVAAPTPPVDFAGSPEGFLIGALLMAIREEYPGPQNKRWAGIVHHLGRFEGMAPHNEAVLAAVRVLRSIDEDAVARKDRGLY